MIIALKGHKYAPELSSIFIGSKRDNLIQYKPKKFFDFYHALYKEKSVSSYVRKCLFTPLKSAKRFVTVQTVYKGDQAWLNRTYRGTVKDYSEALLFLRDIRSKLAEGGTVHIKTELIG